LPFDSTENDCSLIMQLDQALNLIGENFQTLNRMRVESLAAFGSTAHGEATPDQIDRV
jgi:hypothetical protein